MITSLKIFTTIIKTEYKKILELFLSCLIFIFLIIFLSIFVLGLESLNSNFFILYIFYLLNTTTSLFIVDIMLYNFLFNNKIQKLLWLLTKPKIYIFFLICFNWIINCLLILILIYILKFQNIITNHEILKFFTINAFFIFNLQIGFSIIFLFLNLINFKQRNFLFFTIPLQLPNILLNLNITYKYFYSTIIIIPHNSIYLTLVLLCFLYVSITLYSHITKI